MKPKISTMAGAYLGVKKLKGGGNLPPSDKGKVFLIQLIFLIALVLVVIWIIRL